MKKLILILSILVLSSLIFAQTVRYAGTDADLRSAIAQANGGDIINITNNIVVTDQVILNKSLTINGNDYEITVPRPGLDDMGRFNTNPSNFRVFVISTSGVNVIINDLTIKGGALPSGNAGGAIWVTEETVLTLNRCIVSNSRVEASTDPGILCGGGGIYVKGVLYLNHSSLRRNAAGYGGGMLINGYGAVAYVESSSLIENRSTRAVGGGGGAEVSDEAQLFFNNSTLANNQSTEIGGAINCYEATVYFVNSTATGNVAYGDDMYGQALSVGGAIGNNFGDVVILNSLLAYNYRRTAGNVSNPSAYVLDDIRAYTSQSRVRMYYSIHHAPLPSGMGATQNNVAYTGAMDGTGNTIFSGGLLSRITNNNGFEIGAAIFRPYLSETSGSIVATLKSGSFVRETANLGTRTRFANDNNVNPAIAYYHGSEYVDLLGTSAAGQEVQRDQLNSLRANPPARGALEGETGTTLHIVKVTGASGGTVHGGSIYGDVYPAGTSVTLTAIPNSGQRFNRWAYQSGITASSSIQFTFTVNSSVTLVPVFVIADMFSYTIAYIGNGNSGGTPPAAQNFSYPTLTTTIADNNTLYKDGHNFVNWNTNSNGSGTAYAAGSSYSYIDGQNLTLYAQWQEGEPVLPANLPIDFPGGHTFTATVDMRISEMQDLDAFPDLSVSGFSPLFSIVFSGTGTAGITIATDAPWGACYHSNSWHAAANIAGIISFSGVNFDGRANVPFVLANEDLTLPVELSSFSAVYNSGTYVALAWVVESETNHAGYNVLRNECPDLNSAYKVNSSIITQGSALGSQMSYSFRDLDLFTNTTYNYWLESVSNYGTVQYFGPIQVMVAPGGDNETPSIPLQNALLAAYPNPFNPSTTLRYGIEVAGRVDIRIFNTRGQLVKSFTRDHSNAGFYSIIWDGTDEQGRVLSSGAYIYKMKTSDYSATRKVVLSK